MCFNCDELFVVTQPLDFLCYDCQPHCAGCGHKFAPKDRVQKLCKECIEKTQRGECTSCGTLMYPQTRHHTLDSNGHCPDCIHEFIKYQITDESFTCKECKKETLGTNICNDCITKMDTCTYCSENRKYVSEYCCDKCKNRFIRQEKTYKLPQ